MEPDQAETFELSQDDLDHLRRERVRTGAGAVALFRVARNVPEGMSYAVLEGWLAGNTKFARLEFFEWVCRE